MSDRISKGNVAALQIEFSFAGRAKHACMCVFEFAFPPRDDDPNHNVISNHRWGWKACDASGVMADEKLTAFLELERTIREFAVSLVL